MCVKIVAITLLKHGVKSVCDLTDSGHVLEQSETFQNF